MGELFVEFRNVVASERRRRSISGDERKLQQPLETNRLDSITRETGQKRSCSPACCRSMFVIIIRNRPRQQVTTRPTTQSGHCCAAQVALTLVVVGDGGGGRGLVEPLRVGEKHTNQTELLARHFVLAHSLARPAHSRRAQSVRMTGRRQLADRLEEFARLLSPEGAGKVARITR
jgi:hypothetical protein